jgi:predicted negative regulator of RcsB-dependent stress response
MMLVRGSIMSGQYDKAITRLRTVNRIKPDNLEAIVLMADVYERLNDRKNAIEWYQRSLEFTREPALREAIRERINELGK